MRFTRRPRSLQGVGQPRRLAIGLTVLLLMWLESRVNSINTLTHTFL